MIINSGFMIEGSDAHQPPDQSPPTAYPATRKKRISSLFAPRDEDPKDPKSAGGPSQPFLGLYVSQKWKDKKKPVLTIRHVSQAFAVYPERPELISCSNLIKVEAIVGDEEIAGKMRGREGWMLIMPEVEPGVDNQLSEMLKWVIGELKARVSS